MGLYNFLPRFVPRIEIGLIHPDDPRAKTHTIRAPRKGGREDKPGNPMHLYCGLRQKGAYRIEARRGAPPPVCTRVESIVMSLYLGELSGMNYSQFRNSVEVWVGPFLDNVLDDPKKQLYVIQRPCDYGLRKLDEDEAEQFARRDGFADLAEMREFWLWERGLPFYGHVFHWRSAATQPKPVAPRRRK